MTSLLNKCDVIASVSPSAAEYMQNRSWEKYDEDRLTERMVLNDLYECLISDFMEYGIFFECETSELLENDYVANNLIVAMKHIRDAFLVEFTKSHRELLPLLRDLADDKSGEFNKVLTTIQYIYSILGTDELAQCIEFLSDKISSDIEFSRYLSLVVSTIDHISTFTEMASTEQVAAFLHKIDNLRKVLLQYYEVLVPYDTSIDRNTILRFGKHYLHSATIPENLNLATAYFSVSEELRKSKVFSEFVTYILRNSPFHIESYINNPAKVTETSTLTDTQVLLILMGEKLNPFDRPNKSYEEILQILTEYYAYTETELLKKAYGLLGTVVGDI